MAVLRVVHLDFFAFRKEFFVPKMKSHSGAKKRFRMRSSGKISRGQASAGHKLAGKTSKRKSDLNLPADVHVSDENRVKRMLAK